MDFSFKILVLVAVVAGYVLFELVLLALEAGNKRRSQKDIGRGLELYAAQISPAANLAKLGLEAYRPVSSWTPAPPRNTER